MTGGFFRPFGDRLTASSGDELRTLLDQVDVAIPGRTEGRRSEHRERWCIVHYLRTLERNGLLSFPFAVSRTDPPAPDFQVEIGSELLGVEVRGRRAVVPGAPASDRDHRRSGEERHQRDARTGYQHSRPTITGMRDRLIHAYFDVNLDILWTTVTEDLPRLMSALDPLLRAEPSES